MPYNLKLSKIRIIDNKIHSLPSFKFAKFCRVVKITIQIQSLIIRFNRIHAI